MAVQQLSKGSSAGVNLGQSASDLVGFYGLTTPIAQPAAVTTVDTTAITTVDTTAVTTVDTTTITVVTAASTLTAVRTWAIAMNADQQLQAETINKLVADSAANATAINRLITDSAANATAVNTIIARLQALNLIA